MTILALPVGKMFPGEVMAHKSGGGRRVRHKGRHDGGTRGPRQVAGSAIGKWGWLQSYAQRESLFARVAERGVTPSGSLTPADLAGFGLTPDQAALVCWDAVGVRARLAGQSFRQIAELVTPERSHETWRMVARLYLEYSDDLFAPKPGLKLGKVARERLTAAVVGRWVSGFISTADVAALLGERVAPKHALYWLRRRARDLKIALPAT